jgi:peptidoglycan/xylan/chitin deacetylase (PgdA/CDA1 family)
MNMPIALRMDDVGASSKHFEVYSKRWRGLGNALFLKYLPYFKAWGPYRELSAEDWRDIIRMLHEYDAKLTVAVTAAWVERSGECVPYPQKWPDAYQALKAGVESGCIRIACHGLTHCVLEGKAFLPKSFSSNRKFHREFWPWLPVRLHHDNLAKAKTILEAAFEREVDIFVPPGNVFSNDTLSAAVELGFRVLNCQTERRDSIEGLRVIGNDHVVPFHDREIVLFGKEWLKDTLIRNAGLTHVFVDELHA